MTREEAMKFKAQSYSWADDGAVGFQCDCGKSIIIIIYAGFAEDDDNTCEHCGRKYYVNWDVTVHCINEDTIKC